MEFYKKVISGTTYLSCDISSDTIDEVSLGMLSNNKITGLLPLNLFEEDEKLSLNYNISSKLSLDEYLGGLVEKGKLIKTLIGIIDAILLAKEYMLEYKQFVPEMSKIYVEAESGELNLLFLPIEEYDNNYEISRFIKDVLFSIQFDLKTETNYVAEINNYLASATNLYLEDLKKFLENINRRDGVFTNKQINSTKIVENNINASKVSIPNVAPILDTANTNTKEQKAIKEPEKISAVENLNIAKPTVVAKKSFLIPGSEKPVQISDTKKESKKETKKGLFSLFGKKKEKEESKDNKIKQDIQERDVMPYVPESMGETTVLSASSFDETTVLSSSSFVTLRGVLTRKSNGEVRYIEKFFFTLGKDKTNVDYFIDSNSTISRNHANIVCENNEYFIIDNNSLNHTYINGSQLIPNQKTKLNDGDTIVLANEVFTFNIANF